MKTKKKRTEEMFPYWSSLVRMAGSCEKKKRIERKTRKWKRERREREKIGTLDISLETNERKFYIKENKTTCTDIFVILLSRHWCLDIHYHVSTSIL
jgi:hypothetical protein